MKLSVSTTLTFKVSTPSTLILNILPLLTYGQRVTRDSLGTPLGITAERLLTESEMGTLLRFKLAPMEQFTVSYTAEVENAIKVFNHERDLPLDVSTSNASILPFLQPSRYCESDHFFRLAKNMFGTHKNPFEQVMSINTWINQNIEYQSGSTTAQTSALNTFTDQIGVCRDFSHLAIAFCRALTIPARQFSCYAFGLNPQDFHAVYEAYLNGRWVVFDATGLVPLDALVKISVGRDSVDTAIASSFGDITLTAIRVDTKKTNPEEPSLTPAPFEAISYSSK